MNDKTIILAGNPNVGKSSVFNYLTHSHAHTGNWTGKTVEVAKSSYTYNNQKYNVYDLPGTYSLNTHSQEEEVASNFIQNTYHDVTVIVCDATSIERNLNLILQIMQITPKVLICLNLIDEAKRKGLIINIPRLAKLLQVPVIPTSAKHHFGFDKLKEAIANYKVSTKIQYQNTDINTLSTLIAKQVIIATKSEESSIDHRLDKLFTHKVFGFITMFVLFMLIFWITITGANYPSELLFNFFTKLTPTITNILTTIHLPHIIIDLLVSGVYKVLYWVISVMAPPMIIFFPLFTFLEDVGYLPRFAFCLDYCFQKCQSCGKQALTMCMGFGCNAVGVTGSRIIDSKRERLIAILTNCFVPCNGRFPTIIALISIFIIGLSHSNSFLSALILTLIITFSIIITMLVSKILSQTILKGEKSSFTIELPSYRFPSIKKIITESLVTKTLKILYRAIVCSIPAGIIIWILLHITVGDTSLIMYLANFFNPFGKFLGLDGVIILAFLLGLPANEIVMPIALMIYLSSNELVDITNLYNLKEVLINNGWTFLTCLNFIILSLFHFPCATTILTIKKETHSLKWTIASILIPLLIGITLCLMTTTVANLLPL